jgi:hypothetical protein
MLSKGTRTPDFFTFRPWKVDERTGEVRFHYSYDNGIEFCETINFNAALPQPGNPLRIGMDAALEALSIAAGTSYYKAFMPYRLEFDHVNLTRAKREFFQKLYLNGLGEFAYRNKIDISKRINFFQDDERTSIGHPPEAGASSAAAARILS